MCITTVMARHMKRRIGFNCKNSRTTVIILSFVLHLLLLIEQTSAILPITPIKEGKEYQESGPQHFCYHNHLVPGWRETWTRIQIQVHSSRELKVTVVQDEEELQELEHFSMWTLVQYFMREHSNETVVDVGLFSTKTCFRVDPADSRAKYTVRLAHHFDIYLFLVFASGLLLFLYADTLSRSQLFYYSAGMSTGMIASLIILIFIMARLLPKRSPFYVLIVGGWSFSVYLIQLVFRNLQIILKEHWHLAIGYTAVVGFISFAVCYRHGPLVEERSINILSWTLQIFGLLLVYAGIQVQQVALAVIVAAFCAKNLEYPVQLGLTAYRRLSANIALYHSRLRPMVPSELRSQGTEAEGTALQSPKRFADFMEGSPHLMGNEVSIHAQEYGLGGSFFEDELFATDEDEEDEEDEEEQREKPKEWSRNHKDM
ncbi:nuclear envelope integral membrane protein 1 [Anguilla rostrata]|uniref:nuclear envelope integral membrane protein 1 n=1 Tax=Anguilla rostrata TaxID=7938 RepID=UPI0030D58727